MIKQPLQNDNNIILDEYWYNFNSLFPNVSKNQFINWLNEDSYGGWEEAGNRHAGGRRELKMLYATIRLLKPKNILEIGTYNGFSTNHILLAAENNQKDGAEAKVTTIDINDYLENKKLHSYPYNQIHECSLKHLTTHPHYDFVFQDGNHQSIHVAKELRLFSKMKNLKCLFSHDYYLDNSLIKNTFENSTFYKAFQKSFGFKEPSYNAGFHIGIL